jgi:hypothetical protein
MSCEEVFAADPSKPGKSKATRRKWRLSRSCPDDGRNRQRRADDQHGSRFTSRSDPYVRNFGNDVLVH